MPTSYKQNKDTWNRVRKRDCGNCDHGKPHWDITLPYTAFQSQAYVGEMLLGYLPVPRGREKTRSPCLQARSPFCCQSLSQVRFYSGAGHSPELHYDSEECFTWATPPCNVSAAYCMSIETLRSGYSKEWLSQPVLFVPSTFHHLCISSGNRL